MSRQRRVLWSSVGALAVLAGGAAGACGQDAAGVAARDQQAGTRTRPGAAPERSQPAAGTPRPEVVVRDALRANPLTAPYGIATTWREGAVVLSGRVGTKQVHDAAVQLAIAC